MKKFFLVSGLCLFFSLEIIALLITAIDFNSFNLSYYEKMYQKLNVAERIEMSEKDLMTATNCLLDYLKDKRNDLVVFGEINNVDREVFNQREKEHMVDVKALYLKAMMFRNVIFILTFCLLLLAIKKKLELFKPYLISLLILSVVFCGLSIFVFLDFDAFWTQFHLLFFNNDLWLLDPSTDILINMVPLEFFYGLVLNIIISFIFLFIVNGICVYFFDLKNLKCCHK